MSKRAKQKLETGGGASLGQNVFGELGAVEAGKADKVSPSKAAETQKKKGTIGMRREKAGRAGKWATVVHGTERPLPRAEAGPLLDQLKKKLGTGGKLTSDGFELQGDRTQAVAEALEALGYKVKRTGA